jgi:hypothetical protein
VKRIRRWALIAIGGLLSIAAISAFLLFPSTNPWVIRFKTHIIGAVLTYAPLASDDDKWELVLKGVRSGDETWLQVALDLYPALDTHPGEEMLGAVATAFDKNPSGAVRILLPTYGAQVVCGEDEEGSGIDRLHAERRAQLVEGLTASPERAACLTVIRQILGKSGK